jgi:AhpC/TSA family
MSRQRVRTALALTLLTLFIAPGWGNGGENHPGADAAGEAVRAALARFDKDWKDYTNEPHYGDPRWKLKMETLVPLAKAGPAAVSLLQEVAKEGSSWQAHTRNLAAEMLAILRGPKVVREALESYDLTKMDTAVVGKPAPDFSLADASGETYRLSQFRGNKAVVVTFIIQDI